MAKDRVNRIRVQFIIEWPKGLLRVFGAPLKKLLSTLADLICQVMLWLKGSWPWL